MAFVLKPGSKGAAGRNLQRLLIAAGYPVGTIDGDFGGKTDQAVRRFQQEAGFVIDGKASRQTVAALRQAASPPRPGKPEPPSAVIMEPVPDTEMKWPSLWRPPPNVGSLSLLDTARSIIIHCTATPEGKDNRRGHSLLP